MPRAPSTTAAKRIAAAATTGLSAGGEHHETSACATRCPLGGGGVALALTRCPRRHPRPRTTGDQPTPRRPTRRARLTTARPAGHHHRPAPTAMCCCACRPATSGSSTTRPRLERARPGATSAAPAWQLIYAWHCVHRSVGWVELPRRGLRSCPHGVCGRRRMSEVPRQPQTACISHAVCPILCGIARREDPCLKRSLSMRSGRL
jgi:hypothetical protein